MSKIDDTLLDQIAAQCKTQEDIFGSGGLV